MVAVRDEIQDLDFPGGQRDIGWASCQTRRDVRRDGVAATVDLSHGGDEVVGERILQEITGGPGPQRDCAVARSWAGWSCTTIGCRFPTSPGFSPQ